MYFLRKAKLLLITSVAAFPLLAGELRFNSEQSTYQLQEPTHDSRQLTYSDEYNIGRYWYQTIPRESQIFQVATCLANNCTDYSLDDLEEIQDESQQQLGKEDGEVYFANIVTSFLIAAKNNDERLAVLETAKGYLNFNQKIYMAQILGQMMLRNYDDNREHSGIVTEDTIFKSILKQVDAGVCRDIAVAQAQVLKNLDIDDTYLLAYATIDSGHVIVVAQDPNDPSRIVNLNYGEVRISETQNVQALSQDTTITDFGIDFRVFNPDGTPHDRLSTEIGHILNKSLGIDTELSSPGARYDGINLYSVDYTTGIATTNVFYANSASGLTATGLGLLLQKQFKNLSLKGAIAGYKSEKVLEYRDFKSESYASFASLEAQLKSNSTKLGKIENIYVDLKILLQRAAGKAEFEISEYSDEGYFISEHGMTSSSLYAQSKILGLDWKGIITLHASIMKDDVRDEENFSLHYLGSTIRNSISTNFLGKYNISLNSTAYLKEHGSTMDTSIGIHSQDDKYSLHMGVRKQISGDTGFWLIGHEEERYIGAKAKFNDNFHIGLRYSNTSEGGNTYQLEGELRF